MIVTIAGISYPNDDGSSRQEIAGSLRTGQLLKLKRDRNNSHDANAVGVCTDSGRQVGWIPRTASGEVARSIDNGTRPRARVCRVKGGGNYRIGVEIEIDGLNPTESTNSTKQERTSGSGSTGSTRIRREGQAASANVVNRPSNPSPGTLSTPKKATSKANTSVTSNSLRYIGIWLFSSLASLLGAGVGLLVGLVIAVAVGLYTVIADFDTELPARIAVWSLVISIDIGYVVALYWIYRGAVGAQDEELSQSRTKRQEDEAQATSTAVFIGALPLGLILALITLVLAFVG